MNFSSGLIGGIVGDAMKEGPSGLVGGIVGDQIKKDPRGLIGGLAGAMIDDPREAIGGLAGAALGDDFGGRLMDPMSFLNRTLEQNKEVMGPKRQVFPRFADPGDGVLKDPMMAQAVYGPEQPGLGPMIPDSMFNEATERVIPGYTQRRDALRRKIAGMLRGV